MIIAKKRFSKEKIINKNKIPAIINNKNENIMIKIDNNNQNYNFIKKNKEYKIKLFNCIYNVVVKGIKYHSYKKKILHIDFKNNDKK